MKFTKIVDVVVTKSYSQHQQILSKFKIFELNSGYPKSIQKSYFPDYSEYYFSDILSSIWKKSKSTKPPGVLVE